MLLLASGDRDPMIEDHMGVDFEAIIGHTFSATDLPTLPSRLNADAAPDLARAQGNYTSAINRITTKFFSTHLTEWLHIEPQYGIYLDAEGNETAPPPMPEMVEGKRYATPGPSALRRASIEEAWAKSDGIQIVGPDNIDLLIFRQCCTFDGGPRWFIFLEEQDVQRTLRQVAYELSRIVGSPHAIYLPDSTFHASVGREIAWEGGDLDAAIVYLQKECGPPASSITAIQDETGSHRRGDGYFIDDFADLRAEKGQ